jgi:alpha-1,2-mannosyltransferase
MDESVRHDLRKTTPEGSVAKVAMVAGLGSTGYVMAKIWLSFWHHRALDFAVYVMGSHHLTDGRLYSATLSPAPHLLFTYPPFAAVAFAVFAWIPFQLAELLWALVSILSLFAILLLSLRAIRPELARSELLVWSLLLMAPAYRFEPVLLTFAYGQVNLALCALVLADLTWKPRVAGRTVPRGVLVGIAAAVKLVPLVFVLFLFVTRQARAAWIALSAFVACSLVATAFDPSVSWSYWTKYADDAKRIGAEFYISNQSLRGVADRVAHHAVPTSIVTVASAVVLIMGLALTAWAWRTSSNFLAVLICATTGLLVSPISWAHHLVWAVPVVLWLAFGRDRPAWGAMWAVAATAFFWIAPIWNVPNGGTRELSENWWQLLLGNSFFGAMALFLIGIAIMLAVRRRAGPARVSTSASLREADAEVPDRLVAVRVSERTDAAHEPAGPIGETG